MALAIIELKNVSVTFDSEVVLENVSLHVEKEDALVLIGPSGKGKSVLLKVMAGLVPPTKGEVFIHQEELYKLSAKKRQKTMCRMGMLFQKNALFDSLSNFDNIAFPLREVTQASESKIHEIVEKFLDAVGILHAKDLFPDEISGGMQKRLGIARALALNPEIIFYDDPTAGLDPITSRKIVDLILQLKNENKTTVLAVTNEMTRAYQLANKIVMVVDKNIIETGTPEQTQHHQNPKVKQFVHGEITGPLLGLT